jgi:hypothetical protein
MKKIPSFNALAKSGMNRDEFLFRMSLAKAVGLCQFCPLAKASGN